MAPAEHIFGKTAQLVETAHTVSHFQRAVLKIGDYLIVLAVALVIDSCRGPLPRRPDADHAAILPWCLLVAAFPSPCPPCSR